MKRICVYAGSNPGKRPEYAQAARELAGELVARSLGMVYGGGAVGLMGILAETVTEAGGEVIGVMPKALFPKEVPYARGTQLIEVANMHERKALMANLADGFIALPGGYGTFDELFEIITWAQLSIHAKPVGLLNVNGFFDPLLNLIQHSSAEGFISPRHTELVVTRAVAGELLDSFVSYVPVHAGGKWTELPEL